MSELLNESAVLDLYSQYKRSRDVIDLDIYLALRESAREAIELKQHEHEIQQVFKMVMNAKPAGEAMERVAFFSTPAQESEGSVDLGFIGSLKNLAKKFFNVLRPSSILSSPMRGMPMAAGIGVLVLGLFGGVLFNAGVDNNPKSDYVADVFVGNAHLIDQLIVGNQEWQYGFSANTGAAAKAFQAGELAVDLSVIGQDFSAAGAMPIGERSFEILAQRLQAHQPYAGNAVDISMLTSRSAQKIESKLAQYYSKEDIQSQMFQFGQWVEYHYLLSRLAVIDGRVEAYLNNYQRHEELLNKLEAHLRTQNLLSEDDIIRMKEVPVKSLALEDVDQISTLLLKVKSVLSYG